MTIREQIRFHAVLRVVRHIEEHGPSPRFEQLSWECIEGVVERGGADAQSYFKGANEIGLDRLHTEVMNRARHRLEGQGLKAEVDAARTGT